MSYLLDALRKAERERHLDRVPDLAQLHEPDADTPPGGLPGWVAPVVAALVLLNAGVLLMFWFTEQTSVPRASGGDAIDAVRSSPHPTRALLREAEGTASKNEAVSQTVLPHRRTADDPVDDDYPEPAASIADLPADIRDRLPSMEVNGHLYSSIPGRSFILVNGRRYREGERLREGPAVESIGEAGAVLNYRGERFRVAAPR